MSRAGALFQTASGSEGMLTSVSVGTPYVDPGATARDERSAEPGVFVDMSSNVVAAGASDVVTSVPTPPNAPYIVT